MSAKSIPGILINIDSENSAKLKAWVEQIDWQIIVNQIEKRGVSITHDKKPEKGQKLSFFCRLTEAPKERGRYRPHYGDFGGGFSYAFQDHPDGTQIIARSSILPLYKKNIKPLILTIPNKIEITVPSDNYGILSADDSQFKEGVNQFGFHGEFFQLFHAWEWYSEDSEPFKFSFYPSSVGCVATVLHLESKDLLDLTKDLQW